MKRALPPAFVTVAVPAAVFFVLAANPARLYAEAAPAPSSCTALSVEVCAEAGSASACAYDGGAGYCQAALCHDDDSGTNRSALECRPFYTNCASQKQLDDCVGKTLGDACGTGGFCGLLQCTTIDGGAAPTAACLYTGAEPPAEAGPTDGAPSDAETPSGGGDGGGGGGGEAGAPSVPVVGGGGCDCDAAGAPTLAGSAAGLVAALVLMMRRRRD